MDATRHKQDDVALSSTAARAPSGRSKVFKDKPAALIACKVAMRARMAGAATTVFAVLLDHLNWKTMRCDPQIDRLVRLSGYSRSNVQGGLRKLEEDGLLIVHRHGGFSGRNFYEFCWEEIFRRDEAFQKALFPGRGPTRNQGEARPDIRAQTLSKNPDKEPGVVRASTEPPSKPSLSKGQARRDIGGRRPYIPQSPSSQQVAEAAALRRWNDDLLEYLKDEPILFETVVELVDVDIQKAATEAEMKHRGAGLRALFDHVRQIRPELLDSRDRGRNYG